MAISRFWPKAGGVLLKAVFFAHAAAFTALWIRSYSVRDSIYFSTPGWGGVVSSSAGRIVHGGAIWTSPQSWRIEKQATALPAMDRHQPLFLVHFASGGSSWQLNAPHWLALLILGLSALAQRILQSRNALTLSLFWQPAKDRRLDRATELI